MSNLPAQTRALYSVVCLAETLGFVVSRFGEVFTLRDADSHMLRPDATATFLDFRVTDGDLTFEYSVQVGELLADPILTLQRLEKVGAALTEFTFGE